MQHGLIINTSGVAQSTIDTRTENNSPSGSSTIRIIVVVIESHHKYCCFRPCVVTNAYYHHHSVGTPKRHSSIGSEHSAATTIVEGSSTAGSSDKSSGSSGSTRNQTFVQKLRSVSTNNSPSREKKKAKHQRTLQNDGTLTAEQRNVIVLFIKIHIPDGLALYFDIHNDRSGVKSCAINDAFQFFERTEHEVKSDMKLLDRFQSCMEMLTKCFQEKGGQMRQFIVDDKG